MLDTLPLLSIMTFLPILGALLIWLMRSDDEVTNNKNAYNSALFISLFVLFISILVVYNFDASDPDFQFVEKIRWLPALGLYYKMGVDGISVLFVLLSAALTPVCILLCRDSIKKRLKDYVALFLVLEGFMIGTFAALDLFLFYVFFEAVLIPMYLIIGIWGGPRRVYAAFKFFLFTFLGSVFMLLALLYIRYQTGTSDISILIEHLAMPFEVQFWLFLAFFASFAVKMPMWPVHTWLPDAHVEAPTGGSVILAGVLLKMGGYGFLRFSLPMLPEASLYFADMIYYLSVIAIIYTSLVALVQEDMKKLIAYSSVAHMGYVTLGLFTASIEGVQGGIFQMLSHGIVSAALFICVGVVYDRLHTRDISRYGGIVKNMPRYATVFMIFMLASVGLPGTSGFVGEFLILFAAFEASTVIGLLAASGLILGAAYMLMLYRRVVFGAGVHKDALKMPDLSMSEKIALMPLIAGILWLGVYPSSVTSLTNASVDKLLDRVVVSIDQGDNI